jgi:dihydrofolate synthase/folylpolyglutamate synthase
MQSIKPSFFELTVVMAFDYFAKQGVDIAVIETGLGGRLDSTNVIVPEISLITNIGFDHTDLLGDTLSKIAFEKAGIIKPGIPVVIGEYQRETISVFKDKALVTGSPLVCSARRYDITRTYLADELMVRYHIKEKGNKKSMDIKTDLLPVYFQNNIPGILDTITGLQHQGWPISEEEIRRGFKNISKNTGLKGRFQILSRNPTLIADVSHNAEGIRELMFQIKGIPKEKLYLVFGTVIDKDLGPILKELPKNATYYLTQSSVPRSLNVEKLVSIFQEYGFDAVGISNVNDAIRQVNSLANSHDLALVFGSTFVVGEIEQL